MKAKDILEMVILVRSSQTRKVGRARSSKLSQVTFVEVFIQPPEGGWRSVLLSGHL